MDLSVYHQGRSKIREKGVSNVLRWYSCLINSAHSTQGIFSLSHSRIFEFLIMGACNVSNPCKGWVGNLTFSPLRQWETLHVLTVGKANFHKWGNGKNSALPKFFLKDKLYLYFPLSNLPAHFCKMNCQIFLNSYFT